MSDCVVRESIEHRRLAQEAAREAASVLPLFERVAPHDARPRAALEALGQWAEGRRELGMTEVRRLSLGAHAAARSMTELDAKFAARAAGQAVAAWHVPAHAVAAKSYVAKAINAATPTKR